MLQLVRIWLPVAIGVAGFVLIVTGGDAAVGAGIFLLGVALLVVLANLFIPARESRARTTASARPTARRPPVTRGQPQPRATRMQSVLAKPYLHPSTCRSMGGMVANTLGNPA